MAAIKNLPLKNQPESERELDKNNKALPLLIKDEEDSLAITGTTAASDMNYYFDEVKQENNENPGNKTRDSNKKDRMNGYR